MYFTLIYRILLRLILKLPPLRTRMVPINNSSTSPSTSASRKFATLCIHPSGEHEHDPVSGAVIPPISLSTTFAQSEPAKPVGAFEYSRSDNPSRQLFEKSVAVLENGKYGKKQNNARRYS